MRYIFYGERHARREGGRVVTYKSGDPIELTEQEAARFAPGLVKPAKAAELRKAVLRTVDRPHDDPLRAAETEK